jgi:hypothetical protein
MAKDRQRGSRSPAHASAGLKTGKEPPAIVRSSIYLPAPVYEALRKVAFEERLKIHDLVMEGIEAALRRRGYPSLESLKAGKIGKAQARRP